MPKMDINQLSKFIVELAISRVEQGIHLCSSIDEKKGRAGGLIGGKVRAAKLSSDQRSEISKKAAKARWNR